MGNLHRLYVSVPLILITFGSALLCGPAAATTLCADLPPSRLVVCDIKALPPEMVTVSAKEFKRNGAPGDLSSHRPLMVSASEVVTWFDIVHRIMPREDGLVCDAPSLVRMGFGARRRRVFLTSAAAADACVRQTLLDQETAHNRTIEEVVDQFIDRQEHDFRIGVTALKQTPAPDTETAKLRWEQGLRIIVADARRQLFAAIRAASAHADDPLAALGNACGGKVRQLEARSG